MKQTVVGLSYTAPEAQKAVEQLTSNGFNKSDVDSSIGKTSDKMSKSQDFNLDNNNTSDQHEAGVSKFFKNLFSSDDNDTTTMRCNTAASRGNSIVNVHTDSADSAEKAAHILDQYGAINVNEDADSTKQITATGSANTANKGTMGSNTDSTGKTSIPIIQEEMQVGKRTVETGGARLRSRIVERPVEETFRLKEERVYV